MSAGAIPGGHSAVLSPADLALGSICVASLGAVSLGAITGVGPAGPSLCPFLLVTGRPCAFCGVTRSLFALGQRDIRASVEFSPLGGLVALASVGVLTTMALAFKRNRRLTWPRPVRATAATVLAAGWAVKLSAVD